MEWDVIPILLRMVPNARRIMECFALLGVHVNVILVGTLIPRQENVYLQNANTRDALVVTNVLSMLNSAHHLTLQVQVGQVHPPGYARVIIVNRFTKIMDVIFGFILIFENLKSFLFRVVIWFI
jgi:hypothetical protein